MSFLLGADNLKIQRLAGGNIVSHPALYAPTGDILFLISDCIIHVYSSTTGVQIRELEGASSKLVGMELQLFKDDILIGCTVNGELLHWKWSTGQLKKKSQLKIADNTGITSFHQLDSFGDSETAHLLILYKSKKGTVHWRVVETTNFEIIPLPCTLVLNEKPAIAAVSLNKFKIIAIAQQERIYFIDYTTWKWIGLTNGLRIPITCLQWHPLEEMIAIGDKHGRILLWREFWDKCTVKNRLYHWHATPVTSIAFTQSGSGFYSSGMEAVVVIWNVDRPHLQKFVPRISCVVRHIAVSKANVQVAISTLDNGVQIMGNDNSISCNLQEFTFNLADETGKCRFPVGLRTNPRASTLILNGRVGHLQFYSPYTRSLLYNFDVVGQNQLTMEIGRILYNVRVTKAAFNIDWMVTGEVFNDEEHFPELRFKFWRYVEESQSYTLNTSIELPHEGGFRAIEFSSPHQVDNLTCATVGNDNNIKIWALEDTDNIYKKGKVWFCVAETKYKQRPIESISFSQDGSLLAAGCGNTLCVFKSDTLKLKASLSASPSFDGCLSKAEVRVSKNKKPKKTPSKEKDRIDLLQLFSNLLENTDESLLKKLKTDKSSTNRKQSESEANPTFDSTTRQALFQRIMNMHQLSLFQQLLLLQRLQIRSTVTPVWRERILTYLRETIDKAGLTERLHQLNVDVCELNMRSRFKAKYRLQQYKKRRRPFVATDLVPILSLLDLNEKKKTVNGKMSKSESEAQKMDIDDIESENQCTTETSEDPLQTQAEISHVQFAANEYGHLVIACTETRVLIWNLLTLRLENVLKLSTAHLAFDPLTNLAAVFTKNNELHVFQPNVPMPFYQRTNLPKIYGATWLPRRYPKRTSIHVDWQAQSQLYFFTDSQEIMYLDNPDSHDLVDLPAVTFQNPANTIGLRYSTFGTFATQNISDKFHGKHNSGPLIVGSASKTAVKVLVEMSTHTMPPLSLVCNDFLKSLVKPVDSTITAGIKSASKTINDHSRINNGSINGGLNGQGSHDSSDDDDEEDSDSDDVDDDGNVPMTNGVGAASAKTKTKNVEASRRVIITKSEEIKAKHEKHKIQEQNEKLTTETQLKRIAARNIQFEF